MAISVSSQAQSLEVRMGKFMGHVVFMHMWDGSYSYNGVTTLVIQPAAWQKQ